MCQLNSCFSVKMTCNKSVLKSINRIDLLELVCIKNKSCLVLIIWLNFLNIIEKRLELYFHSICNLKN